MPWWNRALKSMEKSKTYSLNTSLGYTEICKDKDTGVSFKKHGHPTDCLDYLLCDLRGYFIQ